MTAPAATGIQPAEAIAAALRDGITSGAVPPGTHLDAAAIGEQHSTHTTHAVSALAALKREGIVWYHDNQRYAAPAGKPDPDATARLGVLLARLRGEAHLTPEGLHEHAYHAEVDNSYYYATPDDIRAAENGQLLRPSRRRFPADAPDRA